jgi:2-polyprenyl-6-methoxyphenol hydroxylase-like FAD-dependent oxidoreductase
MEETDIIIVGAGPTGQTLALTLAHHGIRAKVIDQLPVRSDKSRAVIIQARTLETYRTLGVADEFLARGRRGLRMRQHVKGRPVSVLELTDLGVTDTRFPFTFFISQADTEDILDRGLARAGVEVERPVTATAFEQVGDGIIVTLQGPSGEKRVKARWVVGCDGAHSVVRKAAGLSFDGAAYPQTFLLADIRADELPGDELSFFFGRGGLVVGIPLGEPGCFRLLLSGMIDENVADEPSVDVLMDLVEKISDKRLALSDPTWIARFRLHHRGVDRYRNGRFFVAGDAAHIHSPAGGQAMNTGIQDAYNLAWKLALACRGEADDGLLDSYHAERYPIGQHLMKTTDRLFTAMTSRSLLFKFIRLVIIPRMAPRMMKSRERREKAFRFASQLAMSYPNSPVVRELSKNAPAAFRAGPAAGSRMPDGPTAASDGAAWLHDVIRAPKHHLVLVGGDGAARASALTEAKGACALRGEKLVAPLTLDGGVLSEKLSGGGLATYLVRPDGVISYRAPDHGISDALNHLDMTLGRARLRLPASA